MQPHQQQHMYVARSTGVPGSPSYASQNVVNGNANMGAPQQGYYFIPSGNQFAPQSGYMHPGSAVSGAYRMAQPAHIDGHYQVHTGLVDRVNIPGGCVPHQQNARLLKYNGPQQQQQQLGGVGVGARTGSNVRIYTV